MPYVYVWHLHYGNQKVYAYIHESLVIMLFRRNHTVLCGE